MEINIAAERAYPTPATNSCLLPLLLLSMAQDRNAPIISSDFGNEYDYIIVGGGTAGSVVASRLSEEQCVSVLLLEAGKSPPLLTDVPAYAGAYWGSDIDWNYQTTPQKYTFKAYINNTFAIPQGRVLGGTSVFNGMQYVRGNRKNYDDWASEGAKGWSFDDVYKYFIKLEDNLDLEYLCDGYHGTGGPVSAQKPRYAAEIKHPILDSARELGYKVVDPNGRRQTGMYDLQATQRNSLRCASGKAYLVPAENRTNLDIVTNAFVKKINIEQGRATGVLVDYRGQEYYILAKREVILSAGAIKSPQLLMLSGIGPKEELTRLNIPTLVDLPVGKNLHDHSEAPIFFQISSKIQKFDQKISDDRNIEKFIERRSGPLASAVGASLLAFLDSEGGKRNDFPKFQLLFYEDISSGPLQSVVTEEFFQRVFEPILNETLMICESLALQPKSRGAVTLISNNPYDPPSVNPNYLSHPDDVRVTVEGMKTCLKICTRNPMRKVEAKIVDAIYPGCEEYSSNVDALLACMTRYLIFPGDHFVGTARMGDPNHKATVVDPELRVVGIQGLRVVDASVMPSITSGNVMVPIYMIAEKASDIIKKIIACNTAPTEGPVGRKPICINCKAYNPY